MPIPVWLCDLTYTQQVVSSEVMPAAIGNLATFCEAHLADPPRIRLFKYPETLIAALREGAPRVIGFSCYVWNQRLGYAFAEAIKDKYPGTVVVMGGPNFPLNPGGQERFLGERPAVDFFIEREGEVPLAGLLGRLIEREFDIEGVKRERLANVRAVGSDGRFHAGPLGPRLRDMNHVPSPYLSGKMDEFFDGKLMPIIQVLRGCPFTCTYCVEGDGYYAKLCRRPGETLKAEIEYIGRKMKAVREAGRRNDLFIADSNFGMYKGDLAVADFIADAQDRYGWPEYIVCSTGKNQHERVSEVTRRVRGKIRVSGSVQSTNPEVLENVRRKNVDLKDIFRLADDANRTGAESHSEVILGLPGDSAERHIQSIGDLIDVGFTNIRMYQLILLTGTPMSEEAQAPDSPFGFGTHFRVIPFDYGDYAFDASRRIVTAEIEEIVTSLKDLPFEDYLRCREFALVVDTFYNQGVFQALLKLLRDLRISRFEWIRRTWAAVAGSGLAPLLQAYRDETTSELWESREALERFTSEPDNIRRFLSGELGGKLIFKYKSILAHEHLAELARIARRTALDAVAGSGRADEGIAEFVDDLLTYEVLRKIGLFQGDYEPKTFALSHDVERFLRGGPEPASVADLKFPAPAACRFYLEPGQVEAIERALNAYGRDRAAMTKIISFMRVEDYYRRFECRRPDAASSGPPAHRED